MREKTTNRYITIALCYLAFVLRIELGKIKLEDLEPLALEPIDSKAAVDLIQALKIDDGGSKAITAIHHLLMGTLHQLRSNPFETSSSPFTLFLIFKNTKPTGTIKEPDEISTTITELKWPLRATGFHEIVVRLKDIRVGVDVGGDWQSEVQEVSVEGDSPILK